MAISAFSINNKKIMHSYTIQSKIYLHSYTDQKAVMKELTKRSYQVKNMKANCLKIKLE